jgi:hypothetical protein
MNWDEIPKQADQTWIVTSGARMLPVSLRHPLASARPVPRPAPFRQRQWRGVPTRLSLMPLSRRPAYDDR